MPQRAALALYETCQVAPPSVPEIDASTSFENSELDAQLRRLGFESPSVREADNGPPSKRRKIQEEFDVFDQTVSCLYSLLGAQKATDLNGLSQVAE
jgi:serine/threonine-protein kinase ATR